MNAEVQMQKKSDLFLFEQTVLPTLMLNIQFRVGDIRTNWPNHCSMCILSVVTHFTIHSF